MQNKTLVATAAPENRRGVGFIKSRKSDGRIMDVAEMMIAMSEKRGIRIEEVVVDQSSGLDIDRRSVDRLVSFMERDDIDTLVVHDIFDLSENVDDLMAFLIRARALDVNVLSMKYGFRAASLPWYGR